MVAANKISGNRPRRAQLDTAPFSAGPTARKRLENFLRFAPIPCAAAEPLHPHSRAPGALTIRVGGGIKMHPTTEGRKAVENTAVQALREFEAHDPLT